MMSLNTRILWYFILLFSVVNVLTLRNGHNWGDDFSQYLLHAKNIVEHEPYQRSFDLDQGVVSPPGYPFLLSLLIKHFGFNFILLKLPNIFFWIVFVLSMYSMMKQYFHEGMALLGALVLLTSPVFFIFKQNILTDIPFLASALGTLCLFEKYILVKRQANSHQKYIYLMLAAFLLFYSSLIRFSGVLLLISVLLYFLVLNKDKQALLIIIGAGALSLWIQYVFGVSFAFHMQEKNVPLWLNIIRTYVSLSEIFVYIFDFFLPQWTMIGQAITKILWKIIPHISFFLVIGVVILVWLRSIQKKVTILELFSVVYLFGLIIWGLPGGTRYVFPLVGPFIILGIQLFHYGYKCIQKKMPDRIFFQPERVVGFMLVCLMAHNIYAHVVNFHFDDNDVNKKEVWELVGWVQSHVGREEHVMFPWRRTLGLLTERKMATYFIAATQEKSLNERIRKHNIKYLIFPKKDDVILMPLLEAENIVVQPVWMNDAFRVVKVRE